MKGGIDLHRSTIFGRSPLHLAKKQLCLLARLSPCLVQAGARNEVDITIPTEYTPLQASIFFVLQAETELGGSSEEVVVFMSRLWSYDSTVATPNSTVATPPTSSTPIDPISISYTGQWVEQTRRQKREKTKVEYYLLGHAHNSFPRFFSSHLHFCTSATPPPLLQSRLSHYSGDQKTYIYMFMANPYLPSTSIYTSIGYGLNRLRVFHDQINVFRRVVRVPLLAT